MLTIVGWAQAHEHEKPCTGPMDTMAIHASISPPGMQIPVFVLSRVQLFATQWTIAHQAPLSMGFSRQEDWSGSPFPPPGELPSPGIEHAAPALQADSLPPRKRVAASSTTFKCNAVEFQETKGFPPQFTPNKGLSSLLKQ